MAPETEKQQGETPRLEVTETSPHTLSQFLRSREPSLEILDPSSYWEIFKALRTFSPFSQEGLLVEFFTQRVENFPNGERLGQFLAKINNIVWFKPQEEPNLEVLQKLSDEFYRRLNYHPLPLRIIRDNWHVALDAETDWNANVWRKIPSCGWSKAWNEAWNMAMAATHGVGISLATDAQWAAAWITVEDFMSKRGYDKGNPFEVLFEGINDQGYWFIGPVRFESVIFVPKMQTEILKRLELECFSGPGYRGTKEEFKRFLSQIPFKDRVRLHLSRDLRVDLDTDYFTDSGSVEIHSIDDLRRVGKELAGAQENYHVRVQLLEDDKPIVLRTGPHTWVSPSWGFYLKPSVKSVETFVRLILGEESSQTFSN